MLIYLPSHHPGPLPMSRIENEIDNVLLQDGSDPETQTNTHLSLRFAKEYLLPVVTHMRTEKPRLQPLPKS